MSSIITKDITVHTSLDKQVTVVVEVRGYLDKHFGADYDGNRSKPTWLIDDVIFEIPDTDDHGFVLSQDEKNEVEKLVDEKVGDTDWYFD